MSVISGVVGDLYRRDLRACKTAAQRDAYCKSICQQPSVINAVALAFPPLAQEEPANDPQAAPEPDQTQASGQTPVLEATTTQTQATSTVDPMAEARAALIAKIGTDRATVFGAEARATKAVQQPASAINPDAPTEYRNTPAASAAQPAADKPVATSDKKLAGSRKVAIKAKMDPESAQLLSYISEDFIQLTVKGGLFAYHVESGDELNREAFIAHCGKHYGAYITFQNEDGTTDTAETGTVWWSMDTFSKRICRRVVMEPTSHGADTDPCGSDVFNRWHELKKSMAPVNPEATVADIKILLDHLMFLSDGDAAVVTYFLNWLATLYRFPEVKIPSAILMYSKTGRIGKSMIYELIKRVFGAPLCASADGASIQSKFMDGLEHKRVMFLNEMARSEKQDGYERFKTLISEPEQMFEGKGRAARVIRNITHFVVTTNNEDALPLMENDGRIAVFRCLAGRKPDAYYAELDAWLKGPGPGALAQVLSTWKFPEGWNAFSPVPQTDATRSMQRTNQGELRPVIEEMIENAMAPFNRDFATPEAIINQLAALLPTCRVNHRTVGAVFKAMNIPTERRYRTARQGNVRLVIWRNVTPWAREDITPADRSNHIETGVRPFTEGDNQ